MEQYFGEYHRFETLSKKDASVLLGADNLVGDVFNIDFVTETSQRTAWLSNRFGARVAFFDADFSRQLSIIEARGWTIRALLSFVAFSDSPAPGHYWGEVAVVCYSPVESEAFEHYILTLSKSIAEGVRPEVSLSEHQARHILESGGSWLSSDRVPMPEKKKGTAIMKSHRKISEKLIEQGRKGNKGCYLVSWAFLLCVAVSIVFGLKTCGVF